MNDNIYSLMTEYWKKYYKDSLGLPDWKDRVQTRLNEETQFSGARIAELKNILNITYEGKKILVVGCGTGGELVNFYNEGALVSGIDPDEDAIEIARLKAVEAGIPVEDIECGFGESLKFDSSTFDFVYCFTVLEHVEDVDETIKEIVRVLKVGGYVYFNCPDYRQLYEGHYKLPLPMFLPNILVKMVLMILNRPTEFLDSINKIDSISMRDTLSRFPVKALRLYNFKERSTSPSWLIDLIFRIQHFIYLKFDAPLSQEWFVRKIAEFKNY